MKNLPLVMLICSAQCAQATFSIVAFDPDTGELGIAVQSKIVGVGAVVPWAKAGVGAVATQAWANTDYGPTGLELLKSGAKPQAVIDRLTDTDSKKGLRQVGMVSAKGEVANFTGGNCNAWAGGVTGRYYCVQGNILAGETVITAMAAAFEKAEGELSDRLIAALEAGQAAGGDRRGKQSAALLVVRQGWGYGGFNDRYRDIRVDEHENPIVELKRVHTAHRKLFPSPPLIRQVLANRKVQQVIEEIDKKCREKTIYMIGPKKAERLAALIREHRPERVVECGTAIGYSGLWIARALKENGKGKLITIEIDEARAKEAEANFARAGLGGVVEVRVDDAREAVKKIEGEVDFVFIDCNYANYFPCYQGIKKKLKTGAVIVADNVGMGAGSMVDYLEAVRKFHSATEWFDIDLPWGKRDAMEITVYGKAAKE